MNGFSIWLLNQSKGWLTLLATVVFVLFLIFVLPDQAEKADAYAQGSGSPDTSLVYTPEKLFQLAEAYGEEGRQAYIRARFSFDLIFPLVYGLFLVTSISWLVKTGLAPNSRWRQLNLMPVLGVILDLLENISASQVMLRYPERNLAAAWLASLFTPLKWVFVIGSFLALFSALGVWVYRKVRSGG